MSHFNSCFEFTPKGLAVFEHVFEGVSSEQDVDLDDPSIVSPIEGTSELVVREYETARDLAQAVIDSLSVGGVRDSLPRIGLWCWLTFVFRHQLFSQDESGRWNSGEVHRWLASDPNDWRKGQRHLIRMPAQLLAEFGVDADHLLCGRPSVLPEIREQLTSQQDMFDRSFQRLARSLYFDSKNRKLKVGAGGKGPGSPRRLAQVRRQFDITWDLASLDDTALMEMLPGEFERFKP